MFRIGFYGDPLMDFAKYHNKYESQPRTQLYKVYYAVDFDLHLHHRHLPSAEKPLKKLLSLVTLQPFSLECLICPLAGAPRAPRP